ncbi:protoporphyrinogen oxidase [Paenibacillus sacheonensis]|uniref:Coproporphyrinogen III oxidase n=1 Tax=Paenibacillus sacheonensis TaxID=742054 RepID=A0A7X4YLY6_9BACL|nr:protoporphyrinogen oxidase [Paenibacillus sacheonensis]MBM7563821.1 oxygen-dependent protoporphyrinogen oxidase [Paenibacillus sacheonensis]NBC67829.1 protoporphyrinogen oxidase [Paenibacillus sacheonensis]
MRSNGKLDRFVVIGGGISGLSSAFYLLKEAELRGRKALVTVVDPSERIGGKIDTLRKQGFVIEKGPDSFLARKTAIVDLAFDLGIQDELTGTNPAAKKTYILHRGKLHPMPPGLVLGVPTEIMPFAKTGLISWGGKLRALMDFVLPASKAEGDESVGEFLTRRVGPEVMERIAEPLLAGIYAGDLSKLSLQSTFPQFREAERRHGSLIRGTRANRRKGAAAPAAPNRLPKHLQNSMFLTFKNGLATMLEALTDALAGAESRFGLKAVAFRQNEPGDKQATAPYEVLMSDGEILEADGIVITAPAHDAADLLEPHIPVDALRAVNYVSVANVVMAFDKASFGMEFDGSGFVVPRSEGTTITACTWTSAKWLHSSPDDKVLLRCYVGRANDEEVVDLPDEDLKEAVRRDIRNVLGITAEPIFTEITRLHRSMPQYPVGHVQATAKLRAQLRSQLPGVWAAGAAFDGVGLPDCIRQGKESARIVYDAVMK